MREDADSCSGSQNKEDEVNQDGNEASEDEPAIILALSYSGGQLGGALYDQATTSIRLLHDIGEDEEFRVIDSLLNQVNPTAVLINKAQDLQMIRHLSKICGVVRPDKEKSDYAELNREQINNEEEDADALIEENRKQRDEDTPNGDDNEDDEEDETSKAELRLMPNAAYKYEAATRRITELFAEEIASETEHDLILKFRIDIRSVNMVRSFGALLKYMDAVRLGVEFEVLTIRTPVSSIKAMVVDQMMAIDAASYRALDIFAENKKLEVGWRKALSGDSMGISLFSMCNRCRSIPGKAMLRKWFEHPTLNKTVLRTRQKAISFFAQDCNIDVTALLHQHLGHVKSLRTILRCMRASTAKVIHWKSLYETLIRLVAIGRCIVEKGVRLDLLSECLPFFDSELAEITTVVSAIIDLDESVIENRIVVNRGVDPELDETKHVYRQLPTLLTRVAEEEASRLRAATCSVGYVPMVGYLLALPAMFPVHIFPDLVVMYSMDGSVQVKSQRMNKLDEELGDVKMQIIDKETTIMLRLQKMIVSRCEVLQGALRGAAMIDSAIALAMTARQFGWSCPVLIDEPILDALQVVHPISQLITQNFVPNSVESGGLSSKVKIFTGPNASGKSVYLKQVGIMAFLAHIGSFVPAQNARIGPVDRIMTRMYTVDGVLDGMSTFAKDLDQMALALRRGGPYSLVIIDEFGKGTMTEVGLSLLYSSLNHWMNKGKDACPHVYVSSHFHALSSLIPPDGEVVSFHTFAVLRRGIELKFKFELTDGVVDSSHSAYTATKMGIDADVVQRGVEVYDHLRAGHSLSAFAGDTEEERINTWLAKRMCSIQYDFENWDIDNELEGLLNVIESTLLGDDEIVDVSRETESTIISSVSIQNEHECNDESILGGLRRAVEEEEDDDVTVNEPSHQEGYTETEENQTETQHNKQQEEEKSEEADHAGNEEMVLEGAEEDIIHDDDETKSAEKTTSDERDTTTATERSSILKTSGRRTDKGNFSVSFAVSADVSIFDKSSDDDNVVFNETKIERVVHVDEDDETSSLTTSAGRMESMRLKRFADLCVYQPLKRIKSM